MKKDMDRQLTAIFCDDIRHETGNKMSFMGCYQSELFVPLVPFVLPKLCIYVSAWTAKDNPFKSLIFRVVQDSDSELVRVEMPMEQLAERAPVADETVTRQTVNTAIVFSPFLIEKPTMLRIMAETENGQIVGPRILIKAAPEQSSSLKLSEETGAGKRKVSKISSKGKTRLPA